MSLIRYGFERLLSSIVFASLRIEGKVIAVVVLLLST